MGLAQRQYTFTKFGRKFSVDMFSFLGAVSISIKEDPCETE